MELSTVRIEKPDDINFVLGQSHFIKTVEDIHEALVQAVPGIKFGLAFCESSGATLVRWTGTDEAMIVLAKQNGQALAAGHSFILFLGPGFFSVEYSQLPQDSAGGVPYLLRHGKPSGGGDRRDRTGPRTSRRNRRGQDGRGGKGRGYRLAKRLST